MITNSTDFYGIYSLLTMRSVKRSPAGGRFWRRRLPQIARLDDDANASNRRSTW